MRTHSAALFDAVVKSQKFLSPRTPLPRKCVRFAGPPLRLLGRPLTRALDHQKLRCVAWQGGGSTRIGCAS
jgi:hypothetical protein